MTDLIERLRAQVWPTARSGQMLPPRDPPAINLEAADEIAALRARVAKLEAVVERAIRQAQNIGIDSGSYYETLRAARSQQDPEYSGRVEVVEDDRA